MKKLTKAAKTVEKVYALFVALYAGYAVLLKMTTPNDKKKLDEVINKAIDDTMNVLCLKERPTVNMVNNDVNFIMAVEGMIYYDNFHTKIITGTECNYVLKINEEVLKRELNGHYKTFMNKQVVYDSLYLTVCHELRHMWQYENQWFVGKKYDPVKIEEQRISEGHGTLEEEVDANAFATKIAATKGNKELGEYLDLLQRKSGTVSVNKDIIRKLRKKRIEVAKKYNKAFYIIYNIIYKVLE